MAAQRYASDMTSSRGAPNANPGQAAAVKEKPQAIGWFVGQVMKETGGKANPQVVNERLREKLKA